MLKVGLVEDIEEIRTLQEKFLNAQPDIDVVLSSGSMEDFIQKLDNLPKQPAIIISDIGLPGMTGIEGIQLIKRKYPEIEFIIVSIYTDTDNIYKALCSGAVGYLMKNTPMHELKEAIFTVLEGGSPMTPSIARKVIQHFSPVKRDEENDLSTKELQVVQCIVEGLSYKLCADRLSISINTVRHHIRNIYTKLSINSKTELISRSLSGRVKGT
ncbi:MAG: DNA-binding response regulator [Fluviicola sp.]|nr:MAG: DNA-binding response regulator [Fluviicola sp.]